MCKKNNLPALIEEVHKMQATQPKVEGRKEKQTNEEEGSSSEDEGDVSILTCKILKIFQKILKSYVHNKNNHS